MPGAHVTWEGLGTFASSIEEYGQKIPEKIKQVVAELGQTSKEAMDTNTPVDTGRLKEGNVLNMTDTGFELVNEVYYSGYVNYGTRYMTAQPFLEPAMEVASQELEQKLPQTLEW